MEEMDEAPGEAAGPEDSDGGQGGEKTERAKSTMKDGDTARATGSQRKFTRHHSLELERGGNPEGQYSRRSSLEGRRTSLESGRAGKTRLPSGRMSAEMRRSSLESTRNSSELRRTPSAVATFKVPAGERCGSCPRADNGSGWPQVQCVRQEVPVGQSLVLNLQLLQVRALPHRRKAQLEGREEWERGGEEEDVVVLFPNFSQQATRRRGFSRRPWLRYSLAWAGF